MIKNVKFSNFYSFYSEQEISFVSKKKNTYDYFQSNSGDQITKIAGFVGGNASGKTNVMRLFSFLSYFICKSTKDDSPNLNIAYKTFFNNHEPSKFSIEFEEKDVTFFYEFIVQKNVVIKETLSMKALKEKSAKKVRLFSRKSGKVVILNKEYFRGSSEEFLINIRADVSLIAFLQARYRIEVIDMVYNYFFRLKTNINEQGELNNKRHQFLSLELYLQDKDLKKEMENIIRHFDVGLDSFEIKKEIKDEKASISVDVLHVTNEKSNKLDFIYESRGTQSLLFTLANILTALKNNSVVIVDEIESGLHPEALNKIISYFIDEDKDKKAQIIFSSHSLGFMSSQDMHQIYLVEKNRIGESSTYRLNQVKNIRSDENFLSKYMAGAYGAFPKITT